MQADEDKIKSGEQCPYCNGTPVLDDSAKVYGGKSYGQIWICYDCKAWVGCHPGTTTPLGRLADKTLRRAKQRAHQYFDPLWQRKMRTARVSKSKARQAAYEWLAKAMDLKPEDCHIGMMDVDQCNKVYEICEPFKFTKRKL